MDIIKTTNYEVFKVLPGNRQLKENHLRNLIGSVSKQNMLEQNPIIVNKEFVVIDGQHRLEVAKRLGLPIYYIMIDQAGIAEVQLLNATNRVWTTADYLDSYIARGLHDYQILKDFVEEYKLPLSISMRLLANDDIRTHNNPMDSLFSRFKRGEFKIKFYNQAVEWANNLWAIDPYADPGVITDRDFIGALDILYQAGISQKMLLDKLAVQSERLHRQANIRSYVRVLEDIVNYKRHEANRVLLPTK